MFCLLGLRVYTEEYYEQIGDHAADRGISADRRNHSGAS